MSALTQAQISAILSTSSLFPCGFVVTRPAKAFDCTHSRPGWVFRCLGVAR